MQIDYKFKFDNYLRKHNLFLERELYAAILQTLRAMLQNNFLKDAAIKTNAIKYGVTQNQVKFYIDELKLESLSYEKNQEKRKTEWSDNFYSERMFKKKFLEDDAI